MKKTKTKEDNKVEYGTVSLPKSLINLIKKKIKGTGINSVSSYVSFVLRQILSSSDQNTENKKAEDEVRERLRRLGYI